MFKTLRDKLLGASKQAEEELDPQLNLDYETFRPEERDSGAVIRESHLDNVLWEMELALLQSDVAMEALEEMKEIIKKRLIGLRVENKAAIAPTIEKALKASLVELLSKSEFDSNILLEKREDPLIIAFVGVNGTGKTTTIARITHWLKENGKSVVLAAADTFRAGAIEQLELHANRLGCKFIKHQAGGDPAAVAFDAVVLTKLDVDAKGGAALSISSAIGKPIAFVGIGQEYEDIMPFDSAWIVERIFA